jgi:hypothetical protein
MNTLLETLRGAGIIVWDHPKLEITNMKISRTPTTMSVTQDYQCQIDGQDRMFNTLKLVKNRPEEVIDYLRTADLKNFSLDKVRHQSVMKPDLSNTTLHTVTFAAW